MEAALRAAELLKSFRETRLNGFRSPMEFFDFNRLSRPADFNTAVSRISYNTRYFSGNYSLVILILAVYAILNNLWLLGSLVFLVGGFSLVNKYGADPLQFGDHTVTQKSLYTGLFVIGIPLLLWASPLGTFFWLVGASSIIILGHASIMEPGVESEYAQVDGGV
ncbi:prenylated rab acceptor PRA1 [Thelephora ganbajun]|uniref:Prenylated rab acceptor PRA1 n=1 Tax=Thelephora ganbajun TaxID=370292 RepID=A0ACB6ZW95_THEGA|nr:prenylated rab acceptor PRA1 [Thelephora ganbajun]